MITCWTTPLFMYIERSNKPTKLEHVIIKKKNSKFTCVYYVCAIGGMKTHIWRGSMEYIHKYIQLVANRVSLLVANSSILRWGLWKEFLTIFGFSFVWFFSLQEKDRTFTKYKFLFYFIEVTYFKITKVKLFFFISPYIYIIFFWEAKICMHKKCFWFVFLP